MVILTIVNNISIFLNEIHEKFYIISFLTHCIFKSDLLRFNLRNFHSFKFVVLLVLNIELCFINILILVSRVFGEKMVNKRQDPKFPTFKTDSEACLKILKRNSKSNL